MFFCMWTKPKKRTTGAPAGTPSVARPAAASPVVAGSVPCGITWILAAATPCASRMARLPSVWTTSASAAAPSRRCQRATPSRRSTAPERAVKTVCRVTTERTPASRSPPSASSRRSSMPKMSGACWKWATRTPCARASATTPVNASAREKAGTTAIPSPDASPPCSARTITSEAAAPASSRPRHNFCV